VITFRISGSVRRESLSTILRPRDWLVEPTGPGMSCLTAALPSRSGRPGVHDALRARPGAKGLLPATVHRAENTDAARNLQQIFSALEEIQQLVPLVMPLHPRTHETAARDRASA